MNHECEVINGHFQQLEEERRYDRARNVGSKLKSKVRLTWEEAAFTAAVTDEKV
jgi:hypothetical protein